MVKKNKTLIVGESTYEDFVEYVAREDITESQKEEAWSKVPMSWCKQYLWDWRKANPDYNLLLTPPYVVKKNNLN